jgi:predicted N-acyltransferase
MLQVDPYATPGRLLVLSAPDASPQICVALSLHEIGREAWDACFQDEVEGYDYLLAVEHAGMAGFDWRYIALFEHGQMMAAMPAFVTDYELETTVDVKSSRRVAKFIRRYFPGFLILKLACLGSPCTETGVPGFHPDVPEVRRSELLALLLAGFERFADSQGCALRAAKDIPETQGPALRHVLSDAGFAATPGLPTAWLDVDFASIDEYLQRLSAGTRKDMRRKLKSEQHIRAEIRTDLSDLMPRVMALYAETRNRSDWQFEMLTEGYFAGVLANMRGQALCYLYYAGETLLAANLLVHSQGTLVDKFFCMDAEQGRQYNLYFLSWFNNLRYCLDQGIGRYQSGQAYYENKLRLGSRLTANTMYFKHRNIAAQQLLRLLAPLLSMDDATGEAGRES